MYDSPEDCETFVEEQEEGSDEISAPNHGHENAKMIGGHIRVRNQDSNRHVVLSSKKPPSYQSIGDSDSNSRDRESYSSSGENAFYYDESSNNKYNSNSNQYSRGSNYNRYRNSGYNRNRRLSHRHNEYNDNGQDYDTDHFNEEEYLENDANNSSTIENIDNHENGDAFDSESHGNSDHDGESDASDEEEGSIAERQRRQRRWRQNQGYSDGGYVTNSQGATLRVVWDATWESFHDLSQSTGGANFRSGDYVSAVFASPSGYRDFSDVWDDILLAKSGRDESELLESRSGDYDDIQSMYFFELEQYSLHGEAHDGSSWFASDRSGSNMHTSDVFGEELYYSATLCAGTSVSDPCGLELLPRGVYTWRVTGALNRHRYDVSYSFCGVWGVAQSEVVFEVDCDGDCVPLRVRELEDICEEAREEEWGERRNRYRYRWENEGEYDEYEAPVQLKGTIHIYDLHMDAANSTDLSDQDLGVIRESLVEEFRSVHRHNVSSSQETVQILSHRTIPSNSRKGSLSSRNLGEVLVSHEIEFLLTTVPSRYGVQGADKFGQLEGLAADLSSYLQQSMRSGVFVSRLTTRARVLGSSSLVSCGAASLKDLTLARRSGDADEELAWVGVVLGMALMMGTVMGVLLWYGRRTVSFIKRSDKKASNNSLGSSAIKTPPATVIQYTIHSTAHRSLFHEEVTCF